MLELLFYFSFCFSVFSHFHIFSYFNIFIVYFSLFCLRFNFDLYI